MQRSSTCFFSNSIQCGGATAPVTLTLACTCFNAKSGESCLPRSEKIGNVHISDKSSR